MGSRQWGEFHDITGIVDLYLIILSLPENRSYFPVILILCSCWEVLQNRVFFGILSCDLLGRHLANLLLVVGVVACPETLRTGYGQLQACITTFPN